MTVQSSAPADTALIDTHDMVVVHRVFRREFRLLAELVAEVAPGDTARAQVLSGHFADLRLGLHNHHTGEDELLWPLLLARVDLDAEVVLRMEAQHERVSASLSNTAAAMHAWAVAVDEGRRDALVAALVELRAVMVEHLDDEEAELLPLAARKLTAPEWAALGEHFLETTPKPKLLLFLGAVLEEADPAERAEVLSALPAPARLLWSVVGHRLYARTVRRIRG
jgi:hemerythrin-like domain-containing protein